MFRNPAWLLGVFALPAAALALYALARRRRKAVAAALGDLATVARLAPPELGARRSARALLRAAGLGLVALALAGPQWGVELLPADSKARSVVVAVDVSASMAAEDVRPSRLDKAKEQLAVLIDALPGDRIGVVAFAGEAALVCPVTSDHEAAKQLLRSLQPGLIPTPGTAIGKAIRTAAASLSRYGGGKAVVVISDGEDHKTDPSGAADEAASQEVRVFGIGVGTPEGGPIPIKDDAGNLQGYKKDKKGSTVISKLGEATLADAARRGSGAYYRATASGDEAAAVAEQIRALERGSGGPGGGAAFKNRFLLPLWTAFLLLLAELVVRERAGGWKRLRTALTAGAVALAPAAARAAGAEGELRRGNRSYDAGRYEEALDHYEKASRAAPRDPRPAFNAGAALYRLDKHDTASEAFGAVAGAGVPPALKAAALYNQGNALFSEQKYKEAVDAYRKSLALSPGDEAARHNLAVALRFLKNPQQQPQQKPKGGQDKKQPPQPQKPENGGEGRQKPGEPKTRPRDQLSKEDAERVLRAVGENEKSRAGKQVQLGKEPPKKSDVEEDW